MGDIIFKKEDTVKDSLNFAKEVLKPKKIKVGDFVCKCPDCDGNIVVKNGKYGIFYACDNYPKCKKVLQFDEVQEVDNGKNN